MERPLFIVRNLLSLKAAESIIKLNNYSKAYFILAGNTSALVEAVTESSKRLNNVEVLNFELLKIIDFSLVSFFLQLNENRQFRERVRDLLVKYNISKLFITFPLHLDTFHFFSLSKKSDVEVNFYEEGPCFYRKNRTKQYSICNFRGLAKKLYFRALALDYGYQFEPDYSSSVFPCFDRWEQLDLKFMKVNLPEDLEFLFLSRPVSNDLKINTIEQELEAILAFNELITGESEEKTVLYIKFHPREPDSKHKLIVEKLNSLNINVKKLDLNESSEDIIYSMHRGVVCGYDTSSLIYSPIINSKVKAYSVLPYIKDLDLSGFLEECYNEYVTKYKHIMMLSK